MLHDVGLPSIRALATIRVSGFFLDCAGPNAEDSALQQGDRAIS
jgi:hypothetical protein